MAEESKHILLETVVDASGADQGFAKVEAGAKHMADAMGKAAQDAGKSIDGIGEKAQLTAEQQARAFTGIAAAIKRSTSETQRAIAEFETTAQGGKGSAAFFEKLGSLRGLDPSAIQAMVNPLRELQNQYLELTNAEKRASEQLSFEKQHQDAKKLIKDAEYVRMWTQALEEKEQAEKRASGQKSFIDSLKAESASIGKTRADLLELKAAQLGVSESAAPFIAQLRKSEIGVAQVGMSARATTAALRQVPAQFTDIVTSLQSGQRPLTVLLQQGGQLKDVFGGVLPAARALGGYVASLVNPFTVGAAAFGVLGLAAHQGAEEIRGFQNAATITGNAIGVSASQFGALRESIAGVAGTKGKAAEVLTEIAAKGNLTESSIKGIAEAAILMEKATGQATSKTIEQFSELAKSPAEASAKLNEQYNYLTASVYKQIKALEEQGKTFQAANLAEDTYASAIKSRAQTVLDNAGLLEKAWRGVTGAAKGAWDAMLNIGRPDSKDQQIQALQSALETLQGRNISVGIGDKKGDTSRTAELKQQINLLRESERFEKRLAESRAEQARLQQLGIVFEKQGDEFKTKAQRREEELLKAKTQGQELVKAGIITEIELNKRLSDIRQKYNETTGQSEVAGIQAKVLEQKALLDRLRTANQSPDQAGKVREPTEGEKLVIKIQQELKTGLLGVARAEKEKALIDAQSLAQVDKQVEQETRRQKALEATRAALEGQIDAVHKNADSIRDQAIAQETVNANLGNNKTAAEQATLAQMKLNLAEAEASDRFSPAYVAALESKAAAQERFVNALQKAEFQQAKTKLTESGRVSAEESETLKLEFSLLGQTQQVREQIIAQRKAEVKLAKELAEIEKLNLGQGTEADAQREKLRAEARANAVIDANNAAAKAVLDKWQSTADSINNSLTDALLSAFESGKNFAKGLRDTLIGMFKNMVLRPIIQAQLAPVSGALSSLVGSVTGNTGISSISGFPGAGNLLSGIGEKLGITGPGSITDVVGGILGGGSGISGITASGAEIAGTISSTSEALAGMGASAAEATAAAEALGGSMAATSGALSGISGALAAVPGWGWAALAATTLLGLGQGGETRVGGQYNMQGLINAPSGGDIGGFAGTKSTIANINKSLLELGSSQQLSKFVSGAEQSKNGKGFAYAGGVLTGDIIFGQGIEGLGYQNRRGSKTTEQALADHAEELAQAYLQALQASDIKGLVADYIRGLGDIDLLSGDKLTSAIATVNQATELQSKLLELQSTDAENLARARDKELKAMDESIRSIARQIYAQQDLKKATEATNAIFENAVKTSSDRLLDARKSEREELDSTIKSLRDWSKSIRTFRDQLLSGDLSPLTPTQKYVETRSQLEEIISKAKTGDKDARDQVQNAVTQFLEASATRNASGAAYTADFAYAQNALTALANDAGASADVAKLQLDAANAALSVLGVIDTSTKTAGERVEAAIKELSGNVLAALTAGVNPGAASLSALTAGTTGQFVDTQVGKVYADPAGAAGLGVGGGNFRIYTTDGKIFSGAEARDALVQSINQGGTAEFFKRISLQTGVSRSTMLELLRNTGYESKLPSFAVGTDYVPQNMVAEIHKGERITPAPYNRSDATNADLLKQVETLTDAVRALSKIVASGTNATITATYDATAKAADQTVQGSALAMSRAAYVKQNAPALV